MAAPPARGALSRPLLSPPRAISFPAFAYLFSELISYHRSRVASLSELESRLDAAGAGVGTRLLELATLRDRSAGGRRAGGALLTPAPPTKDGAVALLQYVSATLWVTLFGHPADALDKSTDTANAYMLRDDDPLTNHAISVPKDMARFNPAAYLAGILRGFLTSSGYPCTVQAVTVAVPVEVGPRDKTVLLITFDPKEWVE